ncbi:MULTISPECIES: serine hydrolase [unclassified Pseudomonas]|uniref:serine hydrolase domain-containing protein n=1 Tax=unclassified Pseudomonas TaxID=196821 RepID=UPI000C882125|nr:MULTISPECIES: serine hydrolase domain-containing protein [unclassified Pseudomonas]PMZ87055.1 serine hydrolase [Pseudomonas sp. FW215-T2]PNA13431.1 serine hydrolase [Pseudomonas sp. FW215-R3]PNB38107.1 serine hydrolase [Pseudomonas sp. FW305-131]
MLSSLVSNGQPQTPDRLELITPWWSFTKTVLAATTLSLVRDGLIGLDDPILDQPFTLRQLLRHEAGLADYGEFAEYHAAVTNSESAWSADEMMQRLDGARLRYSPGTGWRYSNVGYLLIGRLIERLTDLTLDDAVGQRALTPLGLSNVRFAKTRADLQTTHLGSTSNYDPAWVYHGLLIGPISQAALFLDRLLCGDLLSTGLIQEMQTARTLGGPIPGRPWITPGYGLGVMQGSIDGGYSLCGHTGCGPGSVIAVYRICDGDASVCCAAFESGASEGAVEAHVAGQLIQVLQQGAEGV